jgi:hypothetical protein
VAKRKKSDISYRSGPPETIDPNSLAGLLAEEAAQEARDFSARFGNSGIRLTISIDGAIEPEERLERFEIPMEKALKGQGVVYGGGTAQRQEASKWIIFGCDFGVRVKDLKEGLAIIRACLKAQSAPKDTRIKQHEPKEMTFGLEA